MKDLFEDIKIIDTDTHWCEPLDIWTSRAPKKYRDLVPQVREDEKGQKGWMFQGARIFPVGALGSGSYVDRDGFKMPDSAWKSLAEKGSFGSIAESALDDDQLDMMRNTPPLEFGAPSIVGSGCSFGTHGRAEDLGGHLISESAFVRHGSLREVPRS